MRVYLWLVLFLVIFAFKANAATGTSQNTSRPPIGNPMSCIYLTPSNSPEHTWHEYMVTIYSPGTMPSCNNPQNKPISAEGYCRRRDGAVILWEVKQRKYDGMMPSETKTICPMTGGIHMSCFPFGCKVTKAIFTQ